MQRSVIFLAILLLSGSALSDITPIPSKNLGSGSLLKTDIVFLDLTQNFDLNYAKYPILATGNNGVKPYIYNQPYFLKNYTASEPAYTFLNFAKIVSEDYVLFFYDQRNLVV